MPRGKSVLFTPARIIGADLVQQLEALEFSATGTRRVCLHEDDQAPLHVMLVQSAPDAVYPRHLHRDSDEIMIGVRGILEVTVWPEGATGPAERHELGVEGSTDGTGMVIPQAWLHQTRALTPETVYLEVKGGPFDPDALVIDPT